MDYREKSETRDGMRIDWDMPIKMDDGLVLRCDIYRPVAEGKYPVIMTLWALRQMAAFRRPLQETSGSACAPTSRTCRPTPPTSISAGRWSIRRNGCRTAMSASASIAAAPAARPASSTSGRCARRRIRRNASTGPACNPGQTARSASTASPTTPRTSGRARHCSPSTSPRSAPGRAPPISTATWRTMAASSTAASCRTGRRRRSIRCRTAAAAAASRAA